MINLFNSGANQIQLLLMRAALLLLRQPAADANQGRWIYPAARALSRSSPSQFDALIAAAARRERVDPALVKAVVHSESNFDPNAVSHAGAQGLMQLMPGTAAALGVQQAFDPAANVAGGTRLLRQLLDRYDQNVALALAAYNAGPGAVDRYDGVPPYAETQRYVPRVLARYRQYRGEA